MFQNIGLLLCSIVILLFLAFSRPVYLTQHPNHQNPLIQCDSIYESVDKMPSYGESDMDFLEYSIKQLAPIIASSHKETEQIISSLKLSLVISKNGQVIEANIQTEMNESLKNKLTSKLLNMPK